jgi:uroporphyrinogen-III decarboxylase
MHLLAQTGADAIAVDQMNDLSASRQVLHNTLLFGNIDPVATLWQGDEAQIVDAVRRAKEAGVHAVWPGCDIVPQSPMKNIRAMLQSAA